MHTGRGIVKGQYVFHVSAAAARCCSPLPISPSLITVTHSQASLESCTIVLSRTYVKPESADLQFSIAEHLDMFINTSSILLV